MCIFASPLPPSAAAIAIFATSAVLFVSRNFFHVGTTTPVEPGIPKRIA
jgi:hypothetical protein